jgi:hypothetical protein
VRLSVIFKIQIWLAGLDRNKVSGQDDVSDLKKQTSGIITMNAVSNWARIKCAIVFIVFIIFSVGPIPITSTIGLLVVIFRPTWFKKLVDDIYADKND